MQTAGRTNWMAPMIRRILPAAALLVPYGLWVSFATALTWTIAANN